MAKESKGGVVTTIGESTLTGWHGTAARAIARPVAKRTRWTEQQLEAAIGLVILAYALFRVLRPTVRALRHRA